MPGAVSRPTRAATRWDPFQSPFMRHGKVQPLSVTTGWYCGPLGGTSGGCMVLVVVVGASGMLAACTRPLTALALASTAAEPRKPLRDNMLLSFFKPSVLAGFTGRLRHGAGSFAPPTRAAARDGSLEVGGREPEPAPGVDCRHGCGDALACFRQQREHVDLHRVVAKQRFVRDDPAQRQHLALVMAGNVVGRA